MNMTEPKSAKRWVIWKGFVPATDPRYQGGWNYLGGKNLSLRSAEPSAPQGSEPPTPLRPLASKP